MFAKKRTGGAAASGKNKQAKHTGPAAARAGKSVDVQDGKSRFFQKPPAALLCTPFVVVWTTLAVLAYWRLAPGVSESAKRFVDVQQCMPGELLPPPSLPTRVPSNVTSEVGQTVRAAKIAWLLESNRADATGEEISDERLKQIYLSGKKSFLRHAANSEMKTYTNETQKRSFDLQRAAGIQQPVVPGMTPQQVRNKVRHEQEKNAPRHQPAFPAAIEDDSIDELPPLRLDYDTWTTMLPNKFTPPKAETDLPLGRARIPANWSLQLNPRNFLVVDADGDILQLGHNTDSCQPCHSSTAGEASTIDDEAASIDMPLEDIVHIEDVSRTTTVATILEVVSRRLGQLGYKGLSLKMAIVIPPVLDHEAPMPDVNLEGQDEVLAL